MPIVFKCSSCGMVIFRLDRLIPVEALWSAIPERCPCCNAQLSRKPLKIEIRPVTR